MRKQITTKIKSILNTVEKALIIAQNQSDDRSALFTDNCLTVLESVKVTMRLETTAELFAEYELCIDQIKDSILMKNKDVNSCINKLKELIDNNITYEIVFMPYKASMWDSLESIWEAAVKDKRCSCSVVPIPYYNRDGSKKGNLTTFHYEGNQFPENVPIVHYDNYNFDENRPDVVYIHNPYDQCNRILSIDPRFYVEELKKKCGMVVYVPYFIFPDKRIKADYVQLPGVVYSDVVVVQSEKVRKQYIDILQSELHIDRSENIVALGSPKIDAVIKAENNKPAIPEEWKKVFNGKKIILYNIHINSFINYGENAIKKLRYVFSCFKKRNDAALLWRPHPLIKETLKSHRPELYEQYIDVQKEFLEMNVGILDETADVHRAISISNAYYGDSSSLVTMYQMTGKHVMIEDVNFFCNQNKRLRTLFSSDFVIKKEKMYFFSYHVNGLFECDISGGTSKLLAIIPDENLLEQGLYCTIACNNDTLILVPFKARYIYEYDICTDKLKQIDLDLKDDMYFSHIESKEYIVFLPCVGKKIIRYSKINGKYDVFNDWYKQINTYHKKGNQLFRSGAVLLKNKLFIPCWRIPVIIEFDIHNGKTIAHKIKCSQNGFIGMDYDGEFFWAISEFTKTVVKWEPSNENVTEYDLLVNELKVDDDAFMQFQSLYSDIFDYDDYMLAIPWAANTFIKINKKDGTFKPFNSGRLNNNKFIKSVRIENKVYCNCYQDNSKYVIDLATSNVEEIKVYVPENYDDVYNIVDLKNNRDIFENQNSTLEKFINSISDVHQDKKRIQCCGRKIHNFVVNAVDEYSNSVV